MDRLSDVATNGTAERLEALLGIALLARERPVEDVLEAVAETARAVLGFRNVVINVYRRAWHDYEAVLVLGGEETRRALYGTTNSYETLHGTLLLERFQSVPGAYFLPAGTSAWEELESTHTAPFEAHPGPDAWQPDDGLLVPLRSTDGAPLGLVSVDDPISGRRPTKGDLQMLVAVCSHAALALETAQGRFAAEVHERIIERVIGFAAELPPEPSPTEILGLACTVARESMGFEAAAAYLYEGGTPVRKAASGRRLDAVAEAMEAAGFDGQDRTVIAALRPSPREGVGPWAWGRNLLCVALRGADGETFGALVLGDPTDRLMPDDVRLQESRLLADQAAAALAFANRERWLQELAVQDPLTGLRNRRDLEDTITNLIEMDQGLAVLIFDLDHFKDINDNHGHDVGDRVLSAFGRLLVAHARDTDLAIRLGGEEFCLLLPEEDADGAAAVAERIRSETSRAGGDLPSRLTVSVGFAVAGADGHTATEVLCAADAALYAAKRGGRDRVCRAVRASR